MRRFALEQEGCRWIWLCRCKEEGHPACGEFAGYEREDCPFVVFKTEHPEDTHPHRFPILTREEYMERRKNHPRLCVKIVECPGRSEDGCWDDKNNTCRDKLFEWKPSE